MTRDELRRLIDAHDAIWNGWWPVLNGLSGSDAQRAIASSFPSVHDTVRHMIVAEAFWQSRLDGGSFDTSANAARDVAGLEHAWRTVQARRSAWLATADPDAEVPFTLESGFSGTAAVWECLIHLASHAHYHRGQVVTMFRQLGLQPPSFDVVTAFAQSF